MELRDFLNTLKSLSFVDRQPWMTELQWEKCSADPVRFLIRADAETQERIWRLIGAKEANHPTPVRETTS